MQIEKNEKTRNVKKTNLALSFTIYLRFNDEKYGKKKNALSSLFFSKILAINLKQSSFNCEFCILS